MRSERRAKPNALGNRKPWFADKTQATYHLMLLPGTIILLLFSYIPMGGLVIAFQKYIPSLGFTGSPWVGLDNFKYLFSNPDIKNKLINTMILACANLALDIIVPIFIAILLNEVRHKYFKSTIQTIIYLPHFLSWVTLGLIFRQFLSLNGMFNGMIQFFGFEAVHFMGSNDVFRPMLIATSMWKEFGWGTIIYLAALTGIDTSQYESARIDGATRLQRIWHITLPGMSTVIILKLILSLGQVLNANFDQVFNLYSPLVYETADIIDTYVYRMGLVQSQFSLSAAVGLFKSAIGTILIVISYAIANKVSDYKIF